MTVTNLKVSPGINVEQTPVLNESGFSASQLVRFRQGIPEKHGGWSAFYSGASGSASPILDIHTWEGLQSDKWLAAGTASSVVAINSNVATQLDPYIRTVNLTSPVAVTSGSPTATITDTGSNAVVGDYINITVPILSTSFPVLYGIYKVTGVVDANHYQITMPSNATATVSAAGVPPAFSSTSGSNQISVAYNAHGFSAGSTYYVNTSQAVGGITIFGVYTVASVTNANTFVINTVQTAASTAGPVSQNGGQNQIQFYPAPNPNRTLPGSALTVTDWTFDNFGAQLIACAPGGPIYAWDPYGSLGTRLTVIPNAPLANDGILISPQSQMVIAWGSSFGSISDPMLIRWCDASNYNSWAATVTNLAGSLRVPTGSRIVGLTNSSNGILVFTDVDVYLMSYVGSPYVYGLNKIAGNCGLQSRHAAVNLGNSTYWCSGSNFFSYSATNGVAPITCTVWDAIFQNLYSSTSPVVMGTNTAFSEVVCFYPSLASSGVNDSYVKLKIDENLWDYGKLARTAWADSTSLGGPIGGDTAGLLWTHETSPDAGGSAMTSYIQTGFFAIQEGTAYAFVDKIWPDIKFAPYGTPSPTATVLVYVLGQDYADGPIITYGPYTISSTVNWIDCRIRNRMLALKFQSTDSGTWWRLGNIRYRVAPSGRRG